MSNVSHFTKDQMFSGLRKVLLAFAEILPRVYAPGCDWAILELDKDASGDGHEGICFTDPEQVDIRKFESARVMDWLYDYGITARWDVSRPTDHVGWHEATEDTKAFLQCLQVSSLLEKSLIKEWQSGLEQCVHVVDAANARWKLDFEKDSPRPIQWDGGWRTTAFMTLNEVALLANMDEKSVRNAANPKSKDPLKTFSHGSRTYVALHDARDWLSRRRGFRQTEHFDSQSVRVLTPPAFCSAQDLGNFIRARREKINVSPSDVVAAMSSASFAAPRLEQLEQGDFFFDVRLFASLAQALELNVKAFVAAGLDLHQKLERKQVEYEIQQF